MTTADITVGKEAEDRIAVASNWKLVWWRFRRHHLAMASAVLLIFMYTIVLVPNFFSTQDPERTDARQAFLRGMRSRPDDEQRLIAGRELERLNVLEARIRERDAGDPVKIERRLAALAALREGIG